MPFARAQKEGLEFDAASILAHCGWTPFQGRSFRHAVRSTVVSGQLAWHAGQLNDGCQGLPLRFRADAFNPRMGAFELAQIRFSAQIRAEWTDPQLFDRLLAGERWRNPPAQR